MEKQQCGNTSDDVRDRLEQHLSRYRLTPSKFKWLWDTLVDLEMVEWGNDKDDFIFLCKRAKKLLSRFTEGIRQQGQPDSTGENESSNDLSPMQRDDAASLTYTDSERARFTALGHYYAKQAAFDRSVQWFRREILGGRSLTPEQMVAFAESPVLTVLSHDDVTKYNIPFPYYDVQQANEKREVSKSGSVLSWKLTAKAAHGKTLRIRRSGATAPPILPYVKQNAQGEYWVHRRLVRQSSVLHTLLTLAQSLTRQYGWEEVDAVLFVLIGDHPRIRPVNVETNHLSCGRPVLTITVEPWVSWKTLEAAYKVWQRQEYDVVPGETGRRAAALLSFVADRMTSEELPGKGAERHVLMKEWNTKADHIARGWDAEGQRWQFNNIDQFSRTLRDAYTGIVAPQYPDFYTQMGRWMVAMQPDLHVETSADSTDNVTKDDSHGDSQEH